MRRFPSWLTSKRAPAPRKPSKRWGPADTTLTLLGGPFNGQQVKLRVDAHILPVHVRDGLYDEYGSWRS